MGGGGKAGSNLSQFPPGAPAPDEEKPQTRRSPILLFSLILASLVPSSSPARFPPVPCRLAGEGPCRSSCLGLAGQAGATSRKLQALSKCAQRETRLDGERRASDQLGGFERANQRTETRKRGTCPQHGALWTGRGCAQRVHYAMCGLLVIDLCCGF